MNEPKDVKGYTHRYYGIDDRNEYDGESVDVSEIFQRRKVRTR